MMRDAGRPSAVRLRRSAASRLQRNGCCSRCPSRSARAARSDVRWESASATKWEAWPTFYRLSVVTIIVPPLRSRSDDIEPIAMHLLDRHRREIGKTITGITPDSIEKLRTYSWPGNVRELENVIQHAIILPESDVITPDLLLLKNSHAASHAEWSTLPFREAESRFEKQYFADVLERAHGNRTRAAELAGLDRTVLHAHLKKIGL
jgi:transcriptional regulator with PAS, ATPase and Fis domain